MVSVAEFDSGAGGIRGTVRRHRLIIFAGLVIALTAAAMAAQLGEATTPFALVFVPFVSALIVAGIADGVHGVVMLYSIMSSRTLQYSVTWASRKRRMWM